MNYYDRPEWSFSELSKVTTSGIDYAVASKRGLLPKKETKAFDLGKLIHDDALHQGEEHWVLKAYPEFRTKEAKEWRDAQTVPIITEEEFNCIASALEQIKSHPLYSELLVGENIQNEVEMFAKINDVEMRGKADSIKTQKNGMKVITDLKSTATFDGWIKNAFKYNYDMQGATYKTLASDETDYFIFLVERVAPFRTAVFHASQEFIDNGANKLSRALEEVKKFGNREIDFHQNLTLAETTELGDWSL